MTKRFCFSFYDIVFQLCILLHTSYVRVRQAINYAIDKDAIYNVVYQGTGTIATAPMSSVVWAYNDKLYVLRRRHL